MHNENVDGMMILISVLHVDHSSFRGSWMIRNDEAFLHGQEIYRSQHKIDGDSV